jgi:rod shape-determining protein MreD
MSPARTAAVVITALTLQVSFFSTFSYDGARPDLMVLLAVLAGYLGGPERGAIVGFAAGMAFDVVLSTPMGLSALVYTLVGYGVGAATAGMVRSSRLAPIAVAAGGSAAAMVLYAVIGTVVGEPTLEGPPLATIVVYVAAINAALAPLAVRALSWAVLPSDRDRHAPYVLR